MPISRYISGKVEVNVEKIYVYISPRFAVYFKKY